MRNTSVAVAALALVAALTSGWAASMEHAEGFARQLLIAAGATIVPCGDPPAGLPPALTTVCARARHDVWSFERAAEPVLFDVVRDGRYDVVDLSVPPRTLVAGGARYDTLRWRFWPRTVAGAGGVEVELLIEDDADYRGSRREGGRERMLLALCRRVPDRVPETQLVEPTPRE